MKEDLSNYLDAFKLARSLEQAYSKQILGSSGWKDEVLEWLDDNSEKFMLAFKKLTPDLEFYCRDYTVPLREAYCLFRLDRGFTMRRIFTHDGKSFQKAEDQMDKIEFFYYLHDSVKYEYRAEGLPETDFHKIYRKMVQAE